MHNKKDRGFPIFSRFFFIVVNLKSSYTVVIANFKHILYMCIG